MKKRNNFKESYRVNLLHYFKGRRKQSTPSIGVCLLVGFITVFFASCSDQGNVGGGIASPETNIKFDTLQVENLRVDTLTAYTGNLGYFSAGKFNDPLFGNITATGFMKPQLAANNDTLVFDNQTEVTLNLAVNPEYTYGDSLSPQGFNLYVIQEPWRGNEWKIHDQIQLSSTSVATFQVNKGDTLVEVSMDDSWIQKYGSFFNSNEDNRDSTFVHQFYGLAVVPQGTDKIVAVNPFNTFFRASNVKVVHPDSVDATSSRYDSLAFGLRNWAFSVNRTNVNSSPASSLKLTSSFERIIRFNFDFSLIEIERYNIAKVELIFYVDKLALQQSIEQAGASATRLDSTGLNLHYLRGDEIPQSLSPKRGPAYESATYNKEDQAFHFDITQQVVNEYYESYSGQRSFYLTAGPHQGVLRSTLIFNSLTTGKGPVLVIRYVKTKD